MIYNSTQSLPSEMSLSPSLKRSISDAQLEFDHESHLSIKSLNLQLISIHQKTPLV